MPNVIDIQMSQKQISEDFQEIIDNFDFINSTLLESNNEKLAVSHSASIYIYACYMWEDVHLRKYIL